MGLYDRIDDEKFGKQVREQAISRRSQQQGQQQGRMMEQQDIEQAQRQQAMMQQAQMQEQQNQQQAFSQGRQQGGQEAIDQTNAMLSQALMQQAEPAGGLGIDPRTVQEIGAIQQQATNQMQEDPNMATAMEMLGQLRKAQAANMPSEELQKIYQSIPGNIRVLIADIQEQEEANRSKNRGGNGKLPMTSRMA